MAEHGEGEMADVVVPGDLIGVAEEFLPGPGTYEFDYQIRAASIGRVVKDYLSKIAAVRPFKAPPIPYPGAVGLVVVTDIREDFARAKILTVNNTVLHHTFTGMLHVNQVVEKAGEIKQMYNYVRIGDLVRSKILSHSPPYLLTIKDARLGVVLAYCSKCGGVLRLINDRLKCPQCGNIESRKIGHGYGHI